ncbi:hypothetical protein NEOLI_000633 [Neolecta irregularis DAH-3]|uniref:Mitochondrial outer membrane protein OM14 C-terminal domain-containing protein n=1 Tax=Neolecta irregularis (strain DAH-3) TaxID=1198029 RepID=A0A1U7LTY6_NEOID|nr:hypothetical protein NEOLI_000633 [Neolecta irregularis DAH-3]|eukprot:OLL26127.1 hypothetical protein NEOLI_000633 [Neolecta irregularis DAH-3]
MATYAQVAAMDAHQSAKEASAGPVPSAPSEFSSSVPETESMINVEPGEGGHIHVVPSDFRENQAETQTLQFTINEEAEQAEGDAKAKKRHCKHVAKINSTMLSSLPVVIGIIIIGVKGIQRFRAGRAFTWQFIGGGFAIFAGLSALPGVKILVDHYRYSRNCK